MKRTKIFLDSEFTGLHQKTTLISLALVAETGENFYAEFTDYDQSQVDDWLRDNVIANLCLTKHITKAVGGWENWISGQDRVYTDALDMHINCTDMRIFQCIGRTPMIKNRLERWLSQFESVEIWSDCLAYDWVLFCELFGGGMKLPSNVYYIPFDICTLFDSCGIDADISRERYADQAQSFDKKHNALYDAIIIKACYDRLMNPELPG